MNTKEALKLLNITDDQFELSVEQLTKIQGIREYIDESEKYITKSHRSLFLKNSATIVLTAKEVEKNIQQAKNEIVDITFDGYTTWYKQHNPDIANMAMYKLAFALESDDHAVSNTTYGNDVCASITLDFDCYNRSIQIFIPNSTKFDDDNEEYNHYYVCPKDEHEENIEAQSKMFDMHDIQGIVKYCEVLYKLFQAEHDLKKLQS